MKTTSETETLQQHPQASAERAPRQATRKRREREKEEAAALHTGGGRRWPVLLGCRRNASRSHFGGWGLHRQPQPRVTATGVACSELSQQLLKFLNPPRPSFNCLSSFLPHSSRLAHGCNPLSQNGYDNNDPDKVSNGKQAARKGFPRSVRGERANFKGLVNGCIEAKFCKKICVGKLSPRST